MRRFQVSKVVGGVVAILGAVMALAVTWVPIVDMGRVEERVEPSAAIIEGMRTLPSDSYLKELRRLGVAADNMPVMSAESAIEAARKVLMGRLIVGGTDSPIHVPFSPQAELYDSSPLSLRLCGFIVPSILVRAYEMSGDSRYLRAAADYVLAWADFEEGLRVPRGLVLYDHAVAARAIVLVELWRVFRSSPQYDVQTARRLVRYARRLSALLGKPNLYEYRSNHGLMQAMSLLHLSLAFPILEESPDNAEIAAGRMLVQVRYLISREGVVLEHSPGYQKHGLEIVAAIGRYLALRDTALPEDVARSYRAGLDFYSALRRPDGTLPTIGDTNDSPYGALLVGRLDGTGTMVEGLQSIVPAAPKQSLTKAMESGYVISWAGLSGWPEPEGLRQTILHWMDFRSRNHKHADELGIALWADGRQWLRASGFWPYDAGRARAVGWRGSNAPHWLDEAYGDKRVSVSLAVSGSESLRAFDVLRTRGDGTNIRRQLILPDDSTWIVLDSFSATAGRTGEVIWKFDRDQALEQLDASRYLVRDGRAGSLLTLSIDASTRVTINGDPYGESEWNVPIMSSGAPALAPAVQLALQAGHAALLSVFTLQGEQRLAPVVSLHWQGDERWSIVLHDNAGQERTLERRNSRLRLVSAEASVSTVLVDTDQPAVARLGPEVRALQQSEERYGTPLNTMLDRREKVSIVVGVAAVVQLLFFSLIRRQSAGLHVLLSIGATACWIALTMFLSLNFLQ